MTDLTIYCYRDYLLIDQTQNNYYGVNLYFIEGDSTQQPPEGQTDLSYFDMVIDFKQFLQGKADPVKIEKSVRKWISDLNPIVQFFRNCIDSGTKEERCLSLAKTAGIKYRRQNAQVLYKFLKLETAHLRAPEKKKERKKKPPIEPPYDLYEAVREHFVEQFARDEYFERFEYDRSELSVASELDEKIEHGDFVFEINQLEPGQGKTSIVNYWGTYHHRTCTFEHLNIFGGFEVQPLFNLLKR